MLVRGTKQQVCCPCFKNNNTEFVKVIDLKGPGLAIYRHTSPIENNEEPSGPRDATNKTHHILVFVLHNTKNSSIVTEEILPQLERERINCPRCRHIFGMLKKIPIISKNEVIGICGHCRKKQLEEPCRKCENAVKKFISSTTEQMYDTKTLIKTWLSRMKKLQQYCNTTKNKTSESLSNIEELCCRPIKSIREPRIKHMFLSGSYSENDSDYVKHLQEQLSLENFVTYNKFDETIKYYLTSGEIQSSPSPSYVKTASTLRDVVSRDTSNTHLKKFEDDAYKTNTQNILQSKYSCKSFKYCFPTCKFDKNITPLISSEALLKVPKLETVSEKQIIKTEVPEHNKKPADNENKQIKQEYVGKKIKTKQIKQENVENFYKTAKSGITKTKKSKSEKVAYSRETLKISENKKPNLTGESSIMSSNTIKASHARNKIKDEFGDLKKLQARYAKQKKEEQAKEKLYNKTHQIILEAVKKIEALADDPLLTESITLTEANINNITSDKVSRKTIEAHKSHSMKVLSCDLCNDSMLELEVGSIEFHKNKTVSAEEIIIGEKLFQCTFPLEQKEEGKEPKPLLFQQNSEFSDVNELTQHSSQEQLQITPEHEVNKKASKGVFKYALSDRTYIDKGWTKLPTEKIMRKMFVYRMSPAQPEYNWFQNMKGAFPKLYDTGDKLVEFDNNGHGRWYYRNGRVALDYYAAEEIHAQQRYVIYSNGEPDEYGRKYPVTVLGTFDYLGNGIIFDHTGKIRLQYNQSEGIVLDSRVGPASHWKWHLLNDPPVLQTVIIEEHLPYKDPVIMELGSKLERIKKPPTTRDEEMISIEFDNFIKAKNKKLTQEFKPLQIKMKALKINENFAIKILDQTRIFLIFRDCLKQLKLNIGMVIDPREIIGTENVELKEVSNSLTKFPARSESLCALQDNIKHARKYEKLRMERENRIRRPLGTVDQTKLDAVASHS